MVPKLDFCYEYEKKSVDYYLNIVPQWIRSYSRSWMYIEKFLRQYAASKRVRLKVVTGTLQTMALGHKNGTFTRITLSGEPHFLPIPRYIWKIAYDQKYAAGVVFIGINNILQKAYFRPICTDISKFIPWFTPSIQKNVYACTIDEFIKRVYKFAYIFPYHQVRRILGLNVFQSTVNYWPY